MPTKDERRLFAIYHLCPLAREAGSNVQDCTIDLNEFIHIEYGDGTERMVCVSGCTFKQMVEQVLEYI